MGSNPTPSALEGKAQVCRIGLNPRLALRLGERYLCLPQSGCACVGKVRQLVPTQLLRGPYGPLAANHLYSCVWKRRGPPKALIQVRVLVGVLLLL